MRRAVDPTIIVATVGMITAALGLAIDAAQAQSPMVPEIRPGVLAGYLPREALPNSLALLPGPPEAGSAALVLDEEISRKSLELRGTPRWKLAAEDANLRFPHPAGTFSCALHAQVSEQDTPRLYLLLRRSLTDAALSTFAAKDRYARARPFMVNGQPSCTPDSETDLRRNGSYPSGHAAAGWAWALILAEIAPDHTDALLARGRAFAQSRVVCNVHWASDVIEGRSMGAATVARLHADAGFLADLAAAKTELAAAVAKNATLAQDCDAEAAAIALDPPRAP